MHACIQIWTEPRIRVFFGSGFFIYKKRGPRSGSDIFIRWFPGPDNSGGSYLYPVYSGDQIQIWVFFWRESVLDPVNFRPEPQIHFRDGWTGIHALMHVLLCTSIMNLRISNFLGTVWIRINLRMYIIIKILKFILRGPDPVNLRPDPQLWFPF